MKKKKSIFVTEGYLLREVIPIKFLKDGVEAKLKWKINAVCSVEVQRSQESTGCSLNVLS